MASGHRKPLYADLFKPPPKPKVEIPASWTSTSTSASSWTHSLHSFDSSSSSSGFTTPQCSELASSASEDDVDFIGELTRQMAEECMLQEGDDQLEARELDRSCGNDVHGSSSGGIASNQVHKVKNQPPVKKLGRKRRVKASESGSTQPQRVNGFFPGSGMQAVYLGGSRSMGTGVFLPRLNTDPDPEPVKVKKKTGGSGTKTGSPIVLIPTRVLQLLHDHFNQLEDSNCNHPYSSSSSSYSHPNHHHKADQSVVNSLQQQEDDIGIGIGIGIGIEEEEEEEEIIEDGTIELPKEWTYTLD